VANEIDRQGLQLARYSTFNALNTTGALPTSQAWRLAAVTGLNQRLDEMAAPRDKRRYPDFKPGDECQHDPGLRGAVQQHRRSSASSSPRE
jgi:hypothetical protein